MVASRAKLAGSWHASHGDLTETSGWTGTIASGEPAALVRAAPPAHPLGRRRLPLQSFAGRITSCTASSATRPWPCPSTLTAATSRRSTGMPRHIERSHRYHGPYSLAGGVTGGCGSSDHPADSAIVCIAQHDRVVLVDESIPATRGTVTRLWWSLATGWQLVRCITRRVPRRATVRRAARMSPPLIRCEEQQTTGAVHSSGVAGGWELEIPLPQVETSAPTASTVRNPRRSPEREVERTRAHGLQWLLARPLSRAAERRPTRATGLDSDACVAHHQMGAWSLI